MAEKEQVVDEFTEEETEEVSPIVHVEIFGWCFVNLRAVNV